jgi:hypothetical protein
MKQGPTISTRVFLKGLGACLAMPAFASRARAATAEAGTTATGAPLRTAFVCFPNGAIPARWWPTGGETDFTLSETLAPLAGLRQHLQIIAGLDQRNAEPGEDGGGDHARGNAVLLTGVRLKKSATDLRAGISIDQVLARHLGQTTRFPSLELSCDAHRRAADCDSGYSCAYQYNVSWQSATTPMPPESNPRLVFERLFGVGIHGERQAHALRRMKERRSVLDFVMQEARGLQKQLAASDREKLDQYLTGVREVEARIQKSERFGPNVDPACATPEGVPEAHGDYVDLMFDMLLLAFTTDSTRVASFVLAHDGDNRSFGDIGINEGHHDLTHHQNDAEKIDKVAAIDRWYVQRLARFLDRLRSSKDVDGQPLLHNTRVLYGSGNADGNRHTHENLPILLAGGGGGHLKGGRFLKRGGEPLCNLFLTLADQAGVRGLEGFGDATARLAL